MTPINPLSTGTEYTVRVQKLSQDQAKVEGEAAVDLIEQAGSPARPVGPNGEGTHVNRYA